MWLPRGFAAWSRDSTGTEGESSLVLVRIARLLLLWWHTLAAMVAQVSLADAKPSNGVTEGLGYCGAEVTKCPNIRCVPYCSFLSILLAG